MTIKPITKQEHDELVTSRTLRSGLSPQRAKVIADILAWRPTTLEEYFKPGLVTANYIIDKVRSKK